MVAPPTAPSGPATEPLRVAPPGPRPMVVVVLPGTPAIFTPLRPTSVVVVTGARLETGLMSWLGLPFDEQAAATSAKGRRRASRRYMARTAYGRGSAPAAPLPPSH